MNGGHGLIGGKIAGIGGEVKRNRNIESNGRPRLLCCMAHFEWPASACHIQEFINNAENTTQIQTTTPTRRDGCFQVGESPTKLCTKRNLKEIKLRQYYQ